MPERGSSSGLARCRLATAVIGAALALAGLLAAPGGAGAVEEIRATVDRNELALGQQLRLTITLQGLGGEPEFEAPDFEVAFRGRSSQVSLFGGRERSFSSMVSFEYDLAPRRSGNLTIGPATVERGGEVFSTEPIRVRVVAEPGQARDTRELFASATVSTRRPYVGQQVVYTLRLYRRVNLQGAGIEPQEFEGFLVEGLGDTREFSTTVNGVEYRVSELRRALFPQREGELVVPPARLTCEVPVRSRSRGMMDDLFGRYPVERRVVTAGPIALEVTPLPPAPEGFGGLVGDFRIKASISQRELAVGESSTLELTVSGTGNAQMIREPRWDGHSGFSIFEDRPKEVLNRGGAALSGRKTFVKALVPTAPGELTLPPAEVVFFDPEEGRYRSSRTAEIALRVVPAEGREELNLTQSLAPSTGKVAVRILADDILPIHKGLGAVARPLPVTETPVLVGGLLAPPLLYLAAVAVRRRRRRFEEDAGLERRLGAYRRAHRRLLGLAGEGGEASAGEAASRCLREYVGDKLGLEGAALTAADADRHLREHGVAEELVRETHETLAWLEAAQFGGAPVGAADAAERLAPLLERLERQIRNR